MTLVEVLREVNFEKISPVLTQGDTLTARLKFNLNLVATPNPDIFELFAGNIKLGTITVNRVIPNFELVIGDNRAKSPKLAEGDDLKSAIEIMLFYAILSLSQENLNTVTIYF